MKNFLAESVIVLITINTKRHKGRIDTDSLVLHFCDSAADSGQVYTIKGSMFDQGLKSLEEIDVSVVYCQGEADYTIGCYSKRHGNVLGVLSGDTDFAIHVMSHCQLLYCKTVMCF